MIWFLSFQFLPPISTLRIELTYQIDLTRACFDWVGIATNQKRRTITPAFTHATMIWGSQVNGCPLCSSFHLVQIHRVSVSQMCIFSRKHRTYPGVIPTVGSSHLELLKPDFLSSKPSPWGCCQVGWPAGLQWIKVQAGGLVPKLGGPRYPNIASFECFRKHVKHTFLNQLEFGVQVTWQAILWVQKWRTAEWTNLRCRFVSLGQGMGGVAQQTIETGYQRGHWVAQLQFLQLLLNFFLYMLVDQSRRLLHLRWCCRIAICWLRGCEPWRRSWSKCTSRTRISGFGSPPCRSLADGGWLWGGWLVWPKSLRTSAFPMGILQRSLKALTFYRKAWASQSGMGQVVTEPPEGLKLNIKQPEAKDRKLKRSAFLRTNQKGWQKCFDFLKSKKHGLIWFNWSAEMVVNNMEYVFRFNWVKLIIFWMERQGPMPRSRMLILMLVTRLAEMLLYNTDEYIDCSILRKHGLEMQTIHP